MSPCFLIAQPSNFIKLPKPTFSPGGYDTVGLKQSMSIADESAGVIDRPVNPSKYRVGPNDVFTINIMMAQPAVIDVTVSPEGIALIPMVGAVNIKDKTLTDAYEAMSKLIRSTYKASTVDIVLKKLKQFKVTVAGAVRKPVIVTATSVDRVSEVLEKAGGLLKDASSRKITLSHTDSTTEFADLLRYYTIGDDSNNPYVQGGDVIYVPFTSDHDYITISGDVRQPGIYEFVDGDKLSTMLRFAQGVTSVADIDSIEIARYEESGLRVQRFRVSAKGLLTSPSGIQSDVLLRYGDKIYVRQRSGVFAKREVSIDGGVRFPGRYAINSNEDRLSAILERAGGLTEDASIEGGVLVRRKDVTYYDRELDRLSKLTPDKMSDNELQYYKVKSAEYIGLVSVDFSKALSGSGQNNPLLIDQDSIYIPRSRNYVIMVGRVNKPGRIGYKKGWGYAEYVREAGGYGYRADEDGIVIQKTTGEQHNAQQSSYAIEPGDNIIVPEKKEVKFYDVFKEALTITAQLATIVGVVLGVVFALRRTN